MSARNVILQTGKSKETDFLLKTPEEISPANTLSLAHKIHFGLITSGTV